MFKLTVESRCWNWRTSITWHSDYTDDSSDYTVDNPLKRNETELAVTIARIFWKLIRYLEEEEQIVEYFIRFYL